MRTVKKILFTDWTLFIATLLMGIGTINVIAPVDTLPDDNKLFITMAVIIFTFISFMVTLSRNLKSKHIL